LVNAVTSLLGLAPAINQRKEEKAKQNVAKTYTIDELMNGDSDSDDEGYGGPTSSKNIYPWR
jgi:hypothetical protein